MIRTLSYSPDGNYLAIGGGPFSCNPLDTTADISPFAIRIINTQTGAVIHNLEAHRCAVDTVRWSPDSSQLASTGDDGRIYIWNGTTGEIATRAQGTSLQQKAGIVWHPDGNMVAEFTPNDRAIRIWDSTSGTNLAMLQHDNNQGKGKLIAIAWHPDGTQIAVADQSGFLYIWDVTNVRTTGNGVLLNSYSDLPAASLAWRSDGLLALGGHEILIVDPDTGTIAQQESGHDKAILSLAWHPDGVRLASGGLDGMVRVWDTSTNTLITSFDYGPYVLAVAWSPDGNTLAYGGVANEDVTIRQVPTAHAGPDQTITDADGDGEEIVTLDGSSSSDSDGTVASYRWTEDDVEITTSVSPQVELAVGIHTIMLTVTDNDGLTDTDTVTITVFE
ncbi:PD40 domain-containing protein [Phototrophicus methaneseepsis]|uniref:PD40 domain-containing protein n=1 Tax=Phototrophicus methaneseepsis TaxID=2710758 RepID=A0A7S8E6P3_9CHLR|nr:PKD domain-containing protein [Phototrophicus methaneseepsis]QPC81352.1 PD40 domain-containing protein [Phototrophicus methaneseepsis]